MSYLEDFDNTPTPVKESVEPAEKPAWAKALAWGILGLGVVYLLNPLAGIDVIPDMIPIAGNLDEAAMVFIVLGALNYLDIQLPEFIERWITPSRQLPSSTERDLE